MYFYKILRNIEGKREYIPSIKKLNHYQLKQPKVCIQKVIFFPFLLSLSQNYLIYFSPVDLDFEYTFR